METKQVKFNCNSKKQNHEKKSFYQYFFFIAKWFKNHWNHILCKSIYNYLPLILTHVEKKSVKVFKKLEIRFNKYSMVKMVIKSWKIWFKIAVQHYWNRSPKLQIECNYQLDDNQVCHICMERRNQLYQWKAYWVQLCKTKQSLNKYL